MKDGEACCEMLPSGYVHDLTADEVTFPRLVRDEDSWETGGYSEVLSRVKELSAADGYLGRQRDCF